MLASEQQIKTMNEQVSGLPVIVGLIEDKTEIIKDLEGLKEGQKVLGDFVSEGFAKGKDRMGGIEDEVKSVKSEIKEVREEMKSLKEIMTNGFDKITSEMHNTKLTELTNELKDKNAKIKSDKDKKDAFKSGLFISFAVLAVGVVLSVIGYLFVKSYG